MSAAPLPEKIRFGMIVLPEKLRGAFPLERTRVTGQITGSLASILVEQHFRNGLTEPAEIEYLFPLPEKAAVFGFDLRIGERTIHGAIQETRQAREQYDLARQQGQQAALVEQRRPNLFAVRVANVLPGKPVSAALRYTEPLTYQDGEWEFVFPMGLTPRYHAPGHAEEAAGADFPIAQPEESIGPVEISLSIQCAAGCDQPTSPSHALNVSRLDDNRLQVQLAQPAIPDHDLVLRYRAALNSTKVNVYAHTTAEGAYFLCNILPPSLDASHPQPAPREFIFVLDRSGSMMGQPIAQARNALRACLRALNPEDTFRILLFDNEMEWFQPEPSTLTQAEMDAADRYLAQVEGRGGTDILTALETALTLPVSQKHDRYVVFLTDGAVSAEERALEKVRQNLKHTRLFTFGIGPSVNRALLRRMAELGRGKAEFLLLDEDIEGAIMRFQDRVSFPAMQSLSLEWHGARVWDVSPTQLPDLYYGEPLQITGRMLIEDSTLPTFSLTGLQGDPVEVLHQPVQMVDEPAIGRVWAHARLEILSEKLASGAIPEEKAREEMLFLALRHQLLSPYTAFVAVDDEVVTSGGKPVVIAVAQPLPKGLEMAGFSGPVPPMPMMAMARGAKSAAGPVFMLHDQSLPGPEAQTQGAAVESIESSAADPSLATPEALLRKLARTQMVNGSWDQDVEMTSAALLAFVRQGHTTHTGSYRQQLRKAYQWLLHAPANPAQAHIRAAVLAALATQTHNAEQIHAAQALAAALPTPETTPTQPPPHTVEEIEDLRAAALANRHVTVSPRLLKGKKSLLAQVWAASIPAES
jgi:Ca-activated chloride channel family protein